MKIAVTKRFRFESAHQSAHPELSREENEALFHKCYRQHGHSYELYVTVEGEPDPVSGFVIDAIAKIVSSDIGVLAARSRNPKALIQATRP